MRIWCASMAAACAFTDCFAQRASSRTTTATCTLPASTRVAFHLKRTCIYSRACSRIDVSPEFSFEHLLHFVKIAAAFAIELAGQK